MRSETDVKFEQSEAKIGDLVKKFNDEAESFRDFEFHFNQLLKDISNPPSNEDLHTANTYIDLLDEQIEKMKSLRNMVDNSCKDLVRLGYDIAKIKSIVNPLIKLESVMSTDFSHHKAQMKAIEGEKPLSAIDKDLIEHFAK